MRNRILTAALVAATALTFLSSSASALYGNNQPSARFGKSKTSWKSKDGFGGGYDFYGYLDVWKNGGQVPTKTRAWGWASVNAELFGKKKSIVTIAAEARATASSNSGNAVIAIMGHNVWSKASSAGISYSKSYSVPFFEASATVMAGPIPVNVGAELAGYAGLTVSATPGLRGASLSAVPNIGAELTLTAGVGTAIASAGVYGAVTLADVETPVTVSVKANGSTGIRYDVRGDLNITTCDGEVGIYASVAAFTWKKAIAGWDGYTWKTNLFHKTGTL